jgi:DNA repair photolyase
MYYLRIFDPWKGKNCTAGTKYSLAPYTGCDHRCQYCYITSYIPKAFNCRLKTDFLKKLPRDLEKADVNIPISIANSSDPYPTIDREYKLTRETLKILTNYGFKVLMVTKSDIYLRDLDIISSNNIVMTITLNTIDDDLASRLEPGAPKPNQRLVAIGQLTAKDIPVMVRVDPIIPYLNEAVEPLLKELSGIGVKYITTSTFKARTDSLKRLNHAFPKQGIKIEKLYREKGKSINRSWYLPKDIRFRLMKRVYDSAKINGLKFNMCRENLDLVRDSPSCDGTHLLK